MWCGTSIISDSGVFQVSHKLWCCASHGRVVWFEMALQDEIPFHQAAWVGTGRLLDMWSYDDMVEDMSLDGWVDVTLELAN